MGKRQGWNQQYNNKEHFQKDRRHYDNREHFKPHSNHCPRWRLSRRATERLCFFMLGILAARLLEILARMQGN